ncbi:hypothetical protein ACR3K2_13890 [Cryptosporidium serpentis]
MNAKLLFSYPQISLNQRSLALGKLPLFFYRQFLGFQMLELDKKRLYWVLAADHFSSSDILQNDWFKKTVQISSVDLRTKTEICLIKSKAVKSDQIDGETNNDREMADEGNNGNKYNIAKLKNKQNNFIVIIKNLWGKYGYIGISVYLIVYVTTLGSFWLIFYSRIINEEFLMQILEFLKISDRFDASLIGSANTFWGRFLIAWIATKITEPFRAILSASLTPYIYKRLLRKFPHWFN